VFLNETLNDSYNSLNFGVFVARVFASLFYF